MKRDYMKVIATVIQLLILSNFIQADDKQKVPLSFSSMISIQEQTTDIIREGQKRALHISLLNTMLPIASGLAFVFSNEQLEGVGALLIGYGIIIGPSTGHIYLKNSRRAITGVLIRSFGTLVIYGAAIGAALSGLCEYDCPSDEEIERGFWAVAIPSAALITWSMVKGFLTLKKSARELYDKGNGLGLLLKHGNDLKSFQVQLTYSF